MTRCRFCLSSDQLELLLAFEENKGLAKLANAMGRDPSVISRGLQRIAEDFPVLAKIKGRWELTPLGRQVNIQSRAFISQLQTLLPAENSRDDGTKISLSDNSVLIIINAQIGLLDSTQEGRNNSQAETNIATLLAHWRKRQRPIVHVKHISDNPQSIFFRNSQGSEFLPAICPAPGERVLEKPKSSAFTDTRLGELLNELNVDNLIIAGFTANECIDATAKDSSAAGITSYVVGDATAMFDLRNPDGKLLKAERLHKLVLANINAYFAKVIKTADLLYT